MGTPAHFTVSSSEALATRHTWLAWLRRLAGTELVLLLVEFLIGMTVNLYVTIPARHPGTNAPEYFSGVARGVLWALSGGALALRLHAIAGLLLAIISVTLIVLAIRTRQRGWIISAIVGFVGVFGAGFNGASFMNYGHDFSSLIMAIGFTVALTAYGLGVYLAR